MDVKKLNACMEMVQSDLGNGLIAASILSIADAQALIRTENSQPGAAAMSCELTKYMQKSLAHGYAPLGRFYFMELEGDKGVLVIPHGPYQWAIAFDTQKVKLGLMINVVLPKLLVAFEEAIKS